MKKVLSVLLAVCMIAALAVPAFAWGADADVVKAEFDKTEYSLNDIMTDNGDINIAELLTCYDKNGNRTCFDLEGKTTADIRAFNSSNNEVLTLTQAGTVTKIMNNKNYDVKVKLTVTLASGVQASTVIVVPANISATGSAGTAYGYRLANAEVTKGSSIAVGDKNATISWTAKALAADSTLTFADDAGATTGTIDAATNDTAAKVAAAVKTAVATLVFNGITYGSPDVVGATVTWTAADMVGDITDLYELTDDQKKVTVAPATPAAIDGTEGADGTTAAAVKLTFVAAAGSKSVTALGVTAALNGKENADQVAAAWLKAFNAKYLVDGASTYKYNTVALEVAPAIAANVVTLTTAVQADTSGVSFKADIDDEVIAYDEVTANALKTNTGADGYTPDALVYNIGDEITPILASYSFTGAQKAAFEFAVRTATGSNSKFTAVTEGGITAYGVNFKLGYDADGFPQLIVADAGTGFKSGTYVYVRVLNKEFANAQIEKEFRIKLVDPASTAVTTKVLPVEKTIGVGQVLDLTTLHSSVNGVKTYWTVEPYGDYQTKTEADLAAKIIIETKDANTTYGWTVKGLAPSVVTVKLYDSYKDLLNGKAADSMKLNIGGGTVAGPTINATTASVKVDETVALNVKTTTADQYVKWAISNENVTADALEGASIKLTGKVAGTTTVTATVYEAKDSTVVEKTLTATVEVKAAEAGNSTGATENPQTGDSIFAHLFF